MPQPLLLPQVALEIKNMPTFDFTPAPKVDPSLTTFTFADPIDAKKISPKRNPVLKFTPSTPVPRQAAEKRVEAATPSGFGDIFKKQPTPESKKTETAAKPLPTQGFGNLFKKVEGMWECVHCMVSNQPLVEKCVACQNSRNKKPEEKPKEKPVMGFGNMFKKPEGNWECSMCMVRNEDG
jgi:Zn-finger in Ran binding protein and others